jgi:hypothetical protein
MQKEKSWKTNFYRGKKTAKRSLVILFALVIYTAPTVCIVLFAFCNPSISFFFRTMTMCKNLGSSFDDLHREISRTVTQASRLLCLPEVSRLRSSFLRLRGCCSPMCHWHRECILTYFMVRVNEKKSDSYLLSKIVLNSYAQWVFKKLSLTVLREFEEELCWMVPSTEICEISDSECVPLPSSPDQR